LYKKITELIALYVRHPEHEDFLSYITAVSVTHLQVTARLSVLKTFSTGSDGRREETQLQGSKSNTSTKINYFLTTSW